MGVSILPRRKVQQPVGDAWSKLGKAVSFRGTVGGLVLILGWGRQRRLSRGLWRTALVGRADVEKD